VADAMRRGRTRGSRVHLVSSGGAVVSTPSSFPIPREGANCISTTLARAEPHA
jgi:hypothetical protein